MRRALFLVSAVFISGPAGAQSVYFGNLHAHTSYSDGSGTPEDAYRAAKDAGLDFFAITEHNHPRGDGTGARRDGQLIGTNPLLYSGPATSLLASANRENRPGQFVTLFGQEISTISTGNHINIFGVGEVLDISRVGNGDVRALVNWVSTRRDLGGEAPLLQFNHPRDPKRNIKDYGRDDFPGIEWVATLDPFVELIEVLNAPALKDGRDFRAEAKEGYYLEYLNLGFHVGPSVGHDNHWRNWGVSTDARIGVIASSLTRPSVMQALRARRTIATEDKNLSVIFRVGEAIGGDRVVAPPPGTPLPLTVEIRDADQAELRSRYRVDILMDRPGGDRSRRPVDTITIDGNTNGRFPLEGLRAEEPGFFILLKITQSRIVEPGDDTDADEHQEIEDRVWTAPIWFEAAAAPVVLPPAALRIIALLPNPRGDEFVNEQVVLSNRAGSAIDLAGWQVRDASGNVWQLSGMVGGSASVRVARRNQPMSLNNDGDEIELVDPLGRVVQSFVYGRAGDGVEVSVPQTN